MPVALYAELVNRLFLNGVSIAGMGLLFAVFGGFVAFRTQDATIFVLVLLGSLASAIHVLVVALYRRRPPSLDLQVIRAWEVRYACPGVVSATCIGLAGAKVFLTDDLGSGMLMTGLIFGYASGTMARTAVRPWIGASRVGLLAISPIAALLYRGHPLSMAHGMLIAAFTIAGLETMVSLYRQVVAEIDLRLTQTERAQRDPLTGLANRRAFDLYLDAELSRLPTLGGMLAVHCIDVDRFKAVNDTYGHPAGDVLLRTLANQLLGLARSTDFVGRIGGDEFVLVQTRVRVRAEAEGLASRIVKAIRSDGDIGNERSDEGLAHPRIRASVSVGVGLASAANLDRGKLLEEADAALYASKSRGRDTYTVHGGASQGSLDPIASLRAVVPCLDVGGAS